MDQTYGEPPPFWRSRGGLALLVVALVGGFLLTTEHRAHVLGFLPYLLLLACPFMHMFMHHGHGHGAHSQEHGQPRSTDDEHPRE
jgi:hypothetical protein